MPHALDEFWIDQGIADDRRQADRASPDRHEILYGLIEDVIGHELNLTGLQLIWAENAIGIAEVGQF
jgi:hypothetical protein